MSREEERRGVRGHCEKSIKWRQAEKDNLLYLEIKSKPENGGNRAEERAVAAASVSAQSQSLPPPPSVSGDGRTANGDAEDGRVAHSREESGRSMDGGMEGGTALI